MIHVSQLTKYYGDYAAIRDISFDVPKGEVVGFLGPNGAGKSTTMKILAGFLNATSGKATIDGLDVFWKPVEVRRRIGYMPENCPLYQEMRVGEYLRFRAGLKGLHGGRRRQRLAYVLDRCWLKDVGRQLIGTLSKGYRQRVGLADALLADPPVLILDEPTSGLDPSQIRESRQLIRELGQQHTILLSTHILSEVEMTCDSVIIIHQGRVAASGSVEALAQQAGENVDVMLEVEGAVDSAELATLAGGRNVKQQKRRDSTCFQIATREPERLTPKLCNLAVEQGWNVRELRPRRRTLEELFIGITEQSRPTEETAAS